MNPIVNVPASTVKSAVDELKKYAEKLPGEFDKLLAHLLVDVLQSGISGPLLPQLPIFSERYAETFKDQIESLAAGNSFDADNSYWMAFYVYAAYQEIFLRSGTFSDLQQKVHAFFDENYVRFPPDIRMRIKYAREKLPMDIFAQNARLSLASVDEKFKEQLELLSDPAAKIGGWDKKLGEWEKRVNQHEQSLKGQAERINFVGLSHAFSQQAEAKEKEIFGYGIWLKVSGCFLILIPFLPVFVSGNVGFPLAWNIQALPFLLPFAVCEVILLYFFRVLLRDQLSAKTQLAQLELRRSLCAFVQGYAEFITPLRREGDPKVLEKFEALVFSGISPDPQSVPSQFDGLDSIVKAMKEIKGKE